MKAHYICCSDSPISFFGSTFNGSVLCGLIDRHQLVSRFLLDHLSSTSHIWLWAKVQLLFCFYDRHHGVKQRSLTLKCEIMCSLRFDRAKFGRSRGRGSRARRLDTMLTETPGLPWFWLSEEITPYVLLFIALDWVQSIDDLPKDCCVSSTSPAPWFIKIPGS